MIRTWMEMYRCPCPPRYPRNHSAAASRGIRILKLHSRTLGSGVVRPKSSDSPLKLQSPGCSIRHPLTSEPNGQGEGVDSNLVLRVQRAIDSWPGHKRVGRTGGGDQREAVRTGDRPRGSPGPSRYRKLQLDSGRISGFLAIQIWVCLPLQYYSLWFCFFPPNRISCFFILFKLRNPIRKCQIYTPYIN